MKVFHWITIRLFCAGVIGFATCGMSSAYGAASFVIPVPITEAKDITIDWLDKKGYDISHHIFQKGRVNYVVNRDGVIFSFDLIPLSALATQVFWKETPFENQLSELLTHLKNRGRDVILIPSPSKKSYIPFAVEKNKDAIVCIYSDADDSGIQLTGFVINPYGLIISTAHNLKQYQRVEVSFKDGRKMTGDVIRIDFHLDLTLIEVKKSLDKYIPLDKGRQLVETGDLLFAIGCPENNPRTMISGYINKPLRRSNNLPLIEVKLDIHLGSSGSPVFDINGRMIGIIKGRYRGTNDLGFLIPYETLKRFMTID